LTCAVAIIQIIGNTKTSEMDVITMYMSLRPTLSDRKPTSGTVMKPTSEEAITTLVPTLGASSSVAVM